MGLARMNKQIETWAFQSTIRQKPKRGKKKWRKVQKFEGSIKKENAQGNDEAFEMTKG